MNFTTTDLIAMAVFIVLVSLIYSYFGVQYDAKRGKE